MREIKFRGKTLDGLKWVYGDLLQDGDLSFIVGSLKEFMDTPFNECLVNPDTVGQYTGFKDRTGMDIYEGDIVEWYQLNIDGGPDMKITGSRMARMRAVVEYSGERFRIAVPEDGDDLPYYLIPGLGLLCGQLVSFSEGELQVGSPAYPDNADEFPGIGIGDLYRAEVIGNIHDNPELLEGK